MSNAVLPAMPGLDWNSTRTPEWSTTVRTSVSGREYRLQNYSYPRWRYRLVYEWLRSDAPAELQQMAAFFNARGGAADTWLYNDPDDNAVTAQLFGTGDGVTTAFQLLRAFGGYTEPVWDVNGTPSIYKAGVLQSSPSQYSISSTGLVTFVAAPAGGQALTWTGAFYWRCRFLQDRAEFQQFMRAFWALRTLEFVTVKP